MQSIYWVLTWACHRRCKHCYDDRFRPYVRDALSEVVGEGVAAYQAVIDNLPDRLVWTDETGVERRTTLILAGGELLIPGVREELFYPAMRALKARYGDAMPMTAIQTAGDVLTPEILDDCLELGIESISVASIDDYHVGMSGDRKFDFMKRMRAMMAERGVREVGLGGSMDPRLDMPEDLRPPRDGEPTFLFFGAQPDLWIGELWPRGRAFANGLSDAAWETNFCARWSGGLNFLKLGEAGSEVSIEPNGNVYPCCLKTRAPIGNLTEETLADMYASVAQLPAIRAINDGVPERMGLDQGWSEDRFRQMSAKADGKGRIVENRCLGCDAYFDAHLTAELAALREARLAGRAGATGSVRLSV
ncbi:MAG: SPASM domain-containing protein [Litorimonas sp.]